MLNFFKMYLDINCKCFYILYLIRWLVSWVEIWFMLFVIIIINFLKVVIYIVVLM